MVLSLRGLSPGLILNKMSKYKFETVEDAVKYIDQIVATHKEEVTALKEKNKSDIADQKQKSADAGSAKDDQVAALQTQVKELTAKVTAAEQERDEANEALNEALGEVGSLSEQLELKSQSRPGAEVIKIGSKNYTLHGRAFNIPGFPRMTVEELSKNREALAYLVEKKSGVLVEAKGSK